MTADDMPNVSQRPLKFKAPEAVEVTGAFATRTMALPEAVIDVTVTMPTDCFYPKDNLNHQYHARRALYLATAAAALQKVAAFKQQRWEYINGNLR